MPPPGNIPLNHPRLRRPLHGRGIRSRAKVKVILPRNSRKCTKNKPHVSVNPLPWEGVDCGGFPQDGVGCETKDFKFWCRVCVLSYPVTRYARATPSRGRGLRSRTHRTQALFLGEGGTNEVTDGCFRANTVRPYRSTNPRHASFIYCAGDTPPTVDCCTATRDCDGECNEATCDCVEDVPPTGDSGNQNQGTGNQNQNNPYKTPPAGEPAIIAIGAVAIVLAVTGYGVMMKKKAGV